MSREHELAGRIEVLEAALRLMLDKACPVYEAEAGGPPVTWAIYLSTTEYRWLMETLPPEGGESSS